MDPLMLERIKALLGGMSSDSINDRIGEASADLREDYGSRVSDPEEDRGLPRIPLAATPAAFAPGVGTGMDIYETVERFQEGDMLGTGIGALATIVPFVSASQARLLKKGIAELTPEVAARARALMSRGRAVGKEEGFDTLAEAVRRGESGEQGLRSLSDYQPGDAADGRFVDLSNLGESIGQGTRGMEGVPQFVPELADTRVVGKNIADRVADPESYIELLPRIEEGIAEGGHLWYDTAPVRDLFVRVLGEGSGGDAFRRYISHMAATSPGSNVRKNLFRGSATFAHDMSGGRGLGRLETFTGQPWTSRTRQTPITDLPGHLPEGLGAKEWSTSMAPYIQTLMDNPGMTIDDLLKAGIGGFTGADAMKLRNFEQDLLGNALGVTVDRHALRMAAGDLSRSKVQPSEYMPLAELIARAGDRFGLTGSAAQGALWTGAKDLTNVRDPRPFAEMFDMALRETRDAIPTGQIGDDDLLIELLSGQRPFVELPTGMRKF